tara:strand:+ start:168 stop:434 length:267 start_codon:yes stop_codon:yes gene_type:complete
MTMPHFEIKERGMTDFIEDYRAQKTAHFNRGDMVKYNKAHYTEKWGFIVDEVPNPMGCGNRVFNVWWIGENQLQKDVWDYDLKSRFYD